MVLGVARGRNATAVNAIGFDSYSRPSLYIMNLDAAIVNAHAFEMILKTLHQTNLFLTRLYLGSTPSQETCE